MLIGCGSPWSDQPLPRIVFQVSSMSVLARCLRGAVDRESDERVAFHGFVWL